ncbi:hypothetical protein PputUW4_03184 [Pseudomonas sp. UW4]|nr:hypothetical protein PputUW4_03184 [Pseudomonas sp. UW4]
MGAGLPAKAVVQPPMMLAVAASSRASSLPQGEWVYAVFVNYRIYCGSGLARESGSSATDDVGCVGLFASKLAPTGLVGVRSICELPNLLWERACPRKR